MALLDIEIVDGNPVANASGSPLRSRATVGGTIGSQANAYSDRFSYVVEYVESMNGG